MAGRRTTRGPESHVAGESPSRRSRADRTGYWYLSTRPLHVLVFLTPLIIAYELGSIVYLSDQGQSLVISAGRILSGFFDSFGAASLHLPAIAMAAVLFAWHVFNRDRWRVSLPVILCMALEAVAWTMPLLVMQVIVAQWRVAPAAAFFGDGGETKEILATLPWQAKLTLSIGAGLYEELLFRLILIAAAHFVLVDLLRMKSSPGHIAAAIISAAAFAAYHEIWTPAGVQWGLAMSYFLAGLYFAAVFISRGFGLVVAVHALYDVLVLVALPAVPAAK